MRWPKFEHVIASLLALGSLGSVTYAAVWQANEQALGALIAVVAAAVGYYLRGRVEMPADPQPRPVSPPPQS